VIGEEGRISDELPSQIDRSFQRSLLLWMRDKYPSMAYEVPKSLDRNDRRFYFNVFYLQERDGLCEALTQESLDGRISWGGAKITAKGVDFLENDGGLSAILGVVTVKLHADTLREMLAKKIEASSASSELHRSVNRPSGWSDAGPRRRYVGDAPAVFDKREELLRQEEHAFELEYGPG
jgi:hypothetical protein